MQNAQRDEVLGLVHSGQRMALDAFTPTSGSAVKAGADCRLGDMFMTQHPRVAAA